MVFLAETFKRDAMQGLRGLRHENCCFLMLELYQEFDGMLPIRAMASGFAMTSDYSTSAGSSRLSPWHLSGDAPIFCTEPTSPLHTQQRRNQQMVREPDCVMFYDTLSSSILFYSSLLSDLYTVVYYIITRYIQSLHLGAIQS